MVYYCFIFCLTNLTNVVLHTWLSSKTYIKFYHFFKCYICILPLVPMGFSYLLASQLGKLIAIERASI